jgi:thioredoxin-related protein
MTVMYVKLLNLCLPDAKVAKYYNDHFISYRLDANSMETQAFVQKQKLNIASTPTFLFYNTDVKIIYQVTLKEKQNTSEIVLQEAAKAITK